VRRLSASIALGLMLGACSAEPLQFMGKPVPATLGCDNVTGAPLDTAGTPDEDKIAAIEICRETARQHADDEFISSLLRTTSPSGDLSSESSFAQLAAVNEKERILYLNCLRAHDVPESCPLAQ